MKLIASADPRFSDSIHLGRETYVDTLYGCFRIDNPRGYRFVREGILEVISGSEKRVTRIIVPESLKFEIAAHERLTNTDLLRIEPLGEHEGTLFLLSMRAGWNQTEDDIIRLASLDPGGCFVAKLRAPGSDIPAGTSVATPLGPKAAWIGMVLVHPELRRQGIATALLHAAVSHAQDSGRGIVGLDATPEGQAVYASSGFKASYRIWRTLFPLSQFEKAGEGVRELRGSALAEIQGYDAKRYFDRSPLLERLVLDRQARCFATKDAQGRLTGYCLTRPGRVQPFVGPLVADSEESARHLLATASCALRRSGAKEAIIDSPEAAFEDRRGGNSDLAPSTPPSRHGLMADSRCVRLFLRMYLAVDPGSEKALVGNFARTEGLDSTHPRVKQLEIIVGRAAESFSVACSFMESEKQAAASGVWGISGPEKG